MNPFETDYLGKLKALAKEAFTLKKYKAMKPFFAIVTALSLVPVIAASFFLLAVLSVYAFLFKVIKSPIEYLHSIAKKEGEEVKHGTQIVIYLISWPLIFFLYAFSALLLVAITAGYAILSILAYIATLGGFKYHVFINEAEDISIDTHGYKYGKSATINFILTLSLLFFVPVVHSLVLIVYLIALSSQGMAAFAVSFYPTYTYACAIYAIIYSLLVFSRGPKESVEKPKKEKSKPEAPVAYPAQTEPYAGAYQPAYQQPTQAYQAPEGYQQPQMPPYSAEAQQPQQAPNYAGDAQQQMPYAQNPQQQQ